MTPSKLRELAEAKSARELAEDKPGTQHVQWWVHLLMASIHAMPEEQRERVEQELTTGQLRQSIAERNQHTVGDTLGLRRRTRTEVDAEIAEEVREYYGHVTQDGKSYRVDGRPPQFDAMTSAQIERLNRLCAEPVAEEPERAPDPARMPARHVQLDDEQCSCEEAERLRKKVEQLRRNIEVERGTSRRLSAQIESLRELIAGWV